MKIKNHFFCILFSIIGTSLFAQKSNCFDDDAPCSSGVFKTYFYDNDGDGVGDINNSSCFCTANVPPKYVLTRGDCDDNNPNVTRSTAWYID